MTRSDHAKSVRPSDETAGCRSGEFPCLSRKDVRYESTRRMLKRRDEILGKARSIAEKCRDEGREFAPAEADDVNAALAEAKRINVTLSAE